MATFDMGISTSEDFRRIAALPSNFRDSKEAIRFVEELEKLNRNLKLEYILSYPSADVKKKQFKVPRAFAKTKFIQDILTEANKSKKLAKDALSTLGGIKFSIGNGTIGNEGMRLENSVLKQFQAIQGGRNVEQKKIPYAIAIMKKLGLNPHDIRTAQKQNNRRRPMKKRKDYVYASSTIAGQGRFDDFNIGQTISDCTITTHDKIYYLSLKKDNETIANLGIKRFIDTNNIIFSNFIKNFGFNIENGKIVYSSRDTSINDNKILDILTVFIRSCLGHGYYYTYNKGNEWVVKYITKNFNRTRCVAQHATIEQEGNQCGIRVRCNGGECVIRFRNDRKGDVYNKITVSFAFRELLH